MTSSSTTPAGPSAATTFAAWPKLIHGRVSFVATCPCGLEARWEQIGQAGVDRYEIACSCGPSTALGPVTHGPVAADPAA